MSVKRTWEEKVNKYGHRVEEMIKAGNPSKAGWYRTPYHSELGTYGYSLTSSEKEVVEAIKDTFGIERLRRPATGVDFIFGNVGFEAKSIDWYEFSENQRKCMDLLKMTFVIVSNGDGPYIHNVIQ